jgi:succinyl-CoA synthetase beta subunit
MKLTEYQGKKFLAACDLPVPRGVFAQTEAELLAAREQLGGKVVVKIQVQAGGRGKAGGVKIATSPEDVHAFYEMWWQKDFKGYTINEFLVEGIIDIKKEMYMSITLNPKKSNTIFMFCSEGGVDVEAVAAREPEKVLKMELEPAKEYQEYHFRRALNEHGIKGAELPALSKTAYKLYQAFINNDLLLVEVNPLVMLNNGEIIAADAKVEVDDCGLFRHPGLKEFKGEAEDEEEREAARIGVTYIKLDGNVGIIASGAGLCMNMMDLIQSSSLKPANFLETGGGITKELMRDSVKLVTKNESVKALIINLYGGINPLVEAAKGIVDGVNQLDRKIVMVVKAMGNRQEECWRILEEANILVIKNHRSEDAIAYIKEQLGVS